MASFFSDFLEKLNLGSPGESAIGIDIGSSAIKVVQLKNERGKAKLETYGALALGPYMNKHVGQAAKPPINTVVEALTDLLRESKTTTKNGGIAIPFRSTLMQVLTLPKIEKDDLEQMVTMEARKYVPTSIEEVDLDWSIIPSREVKNPQSEKKEIKGKSYDIKETVDVLLVAIHNDVVERYQRIVKRSELDAFFFEVEIFSTIRAVMAEETEPVLIFDMGAASVKLYIIERGVVRKTHTINQGSQDLTGAIAHNLDVDMEKAEVLKRGMTPDGETSNRWDEVEKAVKFVLDRILNEAEEFKRSYERKSGQYLSRCILVGGGVRYSGLDKKAQEKLELPTELANPFNQFDTPAFMDDVLAQNGPEFAVAAGIALRKLQEG